MDALVVVRSGDRTAALVIAAVTETSGDRPTVVHTSADAELALRARARDVVVVDGQVTALPVVARIAGERAPAIVGWLPARSSAQAAELLDGGAADVLDGSMGSEELAARLRRVVRDSGVGIAAAPATAGGLAVDARLREVSWHGEPLPLTPRESEVLQVLVAAGGATVRREVIYRQVWRWAMPRGDRTVDVNVKRLRGKLAAAAVPVEIVTQPGVGYRLHIPQPSDEEQGDPAEQVVTGL